MAIEAVNNRISFLGMTSPVSLNRRSQNINSGSSTELYQILNAMGDGEVHPVVKDGTRAMRCDYLA